jgi:hypothetical protein
MTYYMCLSCSSIHSAEFEPNSCDIDGCKGDQFIKGIEKPFHLMTFEEKEARMAADRRRANKGVTRGWGLKKK